MSSFSVWHWLILAMFVAAFYGSYRFAKRFPVSGNADGLGGVRGWLLLLVGLMLLGPFMGAGRIHADFLSAEAQYPNLVTANAWNTYKSATWWGFLAVSCLSFYAGIGLAMGRDISVVKRAKILLWIVDPVASVLMGVLIPLVVFGKVEADPQLFASLIASTIIAAIWTGYLSKSRRVRLTYRHAQQQNAG